LEKGDKGGFEIPLNLPLGKGEVAHLSYFTISSYPLSSYPAWASLHFFFPYFPFVASYFDKSPQTSR
jgi:hypothetical protein